MTEAESNTAVAEPEANTKQVSSAQDELVKILAGDDSASTDDNTSAPSPDGQESKEQVSEDNTTPDPNDAGGSSDITDKLVSRAEAYGFTAEEVKSIGADAVELQMEMLDRIAIRNSRNTRQQPAQKDDEPKQRAPEPAQDDDSFDLSEIEKESPQAAKALKVLSKRLERYEQAGLKAQQQDAMAEFDRIVSTLSPIEQKILGAKYSDELSREQILARSAVGEAMNALANSGREYTLEELVKRSIRAEFGDEIKRLSDKRDADALRKKVNAHQKAAVNPPNNKRKLDMEGMSSDDRILAELDELRQDSRFQDEPEE